MKPLRRPFDLELALPGSKSHANRLLVAAALANGVSTIRGATPCEDVELMVGNLARLGFAVRWSDRARGEVAITGGIPRGPGRATLDCGNAGTTLRFLCAVSALVPGEWTLTGTARMRQRPIGPLVHALRALGADIEDQNGCPPVAVRGGTLRGGRVAVDASLSSQFASALLLISNAAPSPLTLEIADATSEPYLELTRSVLADFAPGSHEVEGDWSAAGAFLVLAELTHSRLRPTNLRPDSAQGDRELPRLIATLREPGELTVDCRALPDQLMNLAVLAAHRHDGTRFVGAANLRHKESNRLAVLVGELQKVGIAIVEHEDGVLVRPSPVLRPAKLDPHGDHRLAMAFALLAMLHAGIEVIDHGCVAKSYPGFFADLRSIHDQPRGVALVGMRGAGKSTLGAALAQRWAVPSADSDAEFERQHGPIAEFVAAHGWPEFRRREEAVVDAVLRPGQVSALGGGAVLSAATRQRLRERALVVFVDEDLAALQERIARRPRPSLTGGDPVDELARVLAERLPLYRGVADLVLAPGAERRQRIDAIDRHCRSLCSW
jgi:3-phosphoshikimate 1-carboxyvinyltransferase